MDPTWGHVSRGSSKSCSFSICSNILSWMSNPIRWATTHFLASCLARRTNKPVVAPDDALTGARGNIWDVRVAVRRASRRLFPFALALGIYSFPSAGSLGTPMQARQSSSIAHRPAARSDRRSISDSTICTRRSETWWWTGGGVAVEVAENISYAS